VNKIVLVAASTLASIAMVGCGSNDSESASTDTTTTGTATTATTTTTTATEVEKPTEVKVVVVDGAPQGGIVRATVNKDDQVVLVVTSDVADEIHLHGYDLKSNAAPGKDAHITFVAKVPGRFEIELEDHGVQIGDLEVEP